MNAAVFGTGDAMRRGETAGHVSAVGAARRDVVRRRVLRGHGAALMVLGAANAVLSLFGAFLGVGMLGFLQENHLAHGGLLQAYLLAAACGVFLWVGARQASPVTWNRLALLPHAGILVSYAIYWNDFPQLMPGGETIRLMLFGHVGFMALQLWAIFGMGSRGVTGAAAGVASRRKAQAGASWPNRLATLVLLMGAGFHAYSVAYGGEALIQNVVTPGVDVLFGLAMLAVAVGMWRVRRRVVLDSRLARIAFWATFGLMVISVPIHVRTAITWSTEYLLLFPKWYSIAEIPLVFLPLAYASWRVRLRGGSAAINPA